MWHLPWAQGVGGSNPLAPTNSSGVTPDHLHPSAAAQLVSLDQRMLPMTLQRLRSKADEKNAKDATGAAGSKLSTSQGPAKLAEFAAGFWPRCPHRLLRNLRACRKLRSPFFRACRAYCQNACSRCSGTRLPARGAKFSKLSKRSSGDVPQTLLATWRFSL
jgi:hypothetical protein